MGPIRFGLAFVLSLGAWGCTNDADDAALGGAGSAPSSSGGAPEGTSPSDGGRSDFRVRMVGLDGAEVSGTAAFGPREAGSEVTVALRPAPAGGMYQGHIHEGDTCDAIGRMKWPLQPVTPAAQAAGQSVTPLAVPVDSIMNGSTVVVFHDQGGQPLVCGDIPVLPPNLPA